MLLLLGTGVYLTLRLMVVQIRAFKHGVAITMGKYDNPDHQEAAQLNHFQALAASLSATVGIGNIAGVATAIHYGGPGAIFWMWITAVFGMALKYSECLLAVKYRKKNPDGTMSGGLMYFISIGLGKKWLGWMFSMFAIIASSGFGNMVQAKSVAKPLLDFLHQ